MESEAGLCLEVKAFGKDGVRLCWRRSLPGKLLAEALLPEGWTVQAEAEAGPEEGVFVVRTLPGAAPRDLPWRLRCGTTTSSTVAPARVAGTHRAAAKGRTAKLEDLGLGVHAVERIYNILQWYGTVLVDTCGEPGLVESLVCPDLARLASLPYRDDALVLGDLSEEALAILGGRVAKCIYRAPSAVLPGLLADFPWLRGPAEEKRAVLPNIVDSELAVGHQGHALKLEEWSKKLSIVGVINLAPNKVKSCFNAIEDRQCYHEVWHDDGEPLWDTVGDGSRLLDVLPGILAAIDGALKARGRVFIHCQQGRSRAASITAARLMVKHTSWCLFDAVAFLAARRPETELNISYAEALDDFAESLGRPRSLSKLQEELPMHLRGGGVARDFRDKTFDAPQQPVD